MKVCKLFDKRPKTSQDGLIKIPENWDIFNAPRPLPGTICWQGEFVHGRWYCAVDPSDEFLKRSLEAINCLDGWRVIYDCEDQYQRWKADKLKKYRVDPEKVNAQMEENLRQQYISNSFGKEMPNATNQ